MSSFLVIKKLSKNFELENKVRALKTINLEFNLGKIYSIIGPSGSGKSTLLNMLSLIDTPSSGKIQINNKLIEADDKNTNDKIRASSIGIIYQNYNLLSDFTAIENVSLAGLAINKSQKEALIEAKKTMTNLGLSKRFNHYPSELSGGENQRVAIARALINKPKLLLADEPSGNLDSKTADQLHKLFLSLCDNFDQTIVLVTHNKELAALGDRSLQLVDGQWS